MSILKCWPTLRCASRRAAGLGPDLTALEVNPLYVRGGEVEALDALATWLD